MEISRHQRRVLLVQAIFLWEDLLKRKPDIRENRLDKEYVLGYIWENLQEERGIKTGMSDFDQERFFGMTQGLQDIQKIITEYAPEWPLDRIASHDRAVLYLGIFELMHTDVPAPVVINESVELAKEFGGERSSKFINGVLSSINKVVKKKEEKKKQGNEEMKKKGNEVIDSEESQTRGETNK
jgi:N utilization substance protein B